MKRLLSLAVLTFGVQAQAVPLVVPAQTNAQIEDNTEGQLVRMDVATGEVKVLQGNAWQDLDEARVQNVAWANNDDGYGDDYYVNNGNVDIDVDVNNGPVRGPGYRPVLPPPPIYVRPPCAGPCGGGAAGRSGYNNNYNNGHQGQSSGRASNRYNNYVAPRWTEEIIRRTYDGGSGNSGGSDTSSQQSNSDWNGGGSGGYREGVLPPGY